MQRFIQTALFLILTPAVLSVLPRILNGEEAQRGQFPWQVGILSVNTLLNQTVFCGGAIIGREWILTSAHCIYGSIYSVVYSGTTDLNSPNRTLSLAQNYIIHENFTLINLQYDVGLIKLDIPLTYDENTRPIHLSNVELHPGIEVTISGFGRTSNDDADGNTRLHYMVVPIMSFSKCQKYLELADIPGIICTYFNDEDDMIVNPCVGDGGAPVVVHAKWNPVHVAMFSFMSSHGCNATYPAAHTQTSTYRSWIRQKSGI